MEVSCKINFKKVLKYEFEKHFEPINRGGA